VQQGFSKKH